MCLGDPLHRCLVCGRRFPEGQGLVISRGGLRVEFHSSRCASKFLKRLLTEVEDSLCIEKTVKRIIKEYEELLKLKERAKEL